MILSYDAFSYNTANYKHHIPTAKETGRKTELQICGKMEYCYFHSELIKAYFFPLQQLFSLLDKQGKLCGVSASSCIPYTSKTPISFCKSLTLVGQIHNQSVKCRTVAI